MSFSLTAEWQAQSAILLTWPHKNTDWADDLLNIEKVYIQVCFHITRFQKIIIACHDESLQKHVLHLLKENIINTNSVHTFIAPSNDTWARDYGPITLTNEDDTLICDFTFNAWGNKYSSQLDNKITQQLIIQPFCQLQHYQHYDLILEGGSIESDGEGSILTTEKCLLNTNRNPQYSKQNIEQGLKGILGVSQILWLKHGSLIGDDTDAHIDTLARFSPNGIVYVSSDNTNDLNYQELKLMEEELKSFKKVNGESYKLFPLPSPENIFNKNNQPLPATYANFLIINDAVLVPTYNDKNDAIALNVIAQAYPNREIIGIDCTAVIQQFGSLHCLTMQLPAGLIQ